ncbi:hypothetical protein LAZ67_10001248 [Cordylochernes scorpioides]|uniref:Integrase zinc-binding domain-containing protein n=1 Tax=Cordylochernes scorpioides TaxID=51811 RepID=A0ABY6KYH4_9ARAC|nr:hypothetical protein LAZ67_10001248 [Cordylochernes scorpioides]
MHSAFSMEKQGYVDGTGSLRNASLDLWGHFLTVFSNPRENENAMRHEQVNHELAHTIVNDFYVDDCLTGADSEENCMDLRRELSEVNEAGGFHLCKFNSNSRAVIESIPEELRAEGVKSLNEKSIIPAGNVLANKVPAEQKTPAILPSDHHVTELLIQAEHERCVHQGSEILLNNLRGRLWNIDGRQMVLQTIRKCLRCRLSRASPVIPEMGQLPHYILAAYQRPFTFTGLDAFGPFTVTVGRRHEKRWVIIFTCLVTRAIHLEVVHALSTDEFMMGLSQFIDTRGRPDVVFCV